MGIKEDGLSVLMRATSYSFYPIFAICFALMIAGTGRDFGPMRVAELAARERCLKRLRDASSASASHATTAGSSVSRTCADQRPIFSRSHTAQPHANPAPHANALTSSQSHPDPRTQQPTPISSSSPTPSSTDPLAQDTQWEVDSCHNHAAQSGLAQEDSGRAAWAGEGGGSGTQHRLVRPSIAYSKDLAACELGEVEAEGEGEGRAVGREERNEELAMEDEGGGMAEGGDMAAVLDPHMQHDPSKPMRCINAAVPVGVRPKKRFTVSW